MAAHVRALMAAGMTATAIAAAAGVSASTVKNLNRAVRPTIQGPVAAAILAVTFTVTEKRWPGHIDPTGTRRRIQALAAIGHTLRSQARWMGTNDSTLHRIAHGIAPSVHANLAARVAAVYRVLSTRQPPRSVHAVRIRNVAAREGWHSPIAWPDIDDPQAGPELACGEGPDLLPDEVAVGYVVSGFRRWTYLTREVDRREVVRRLAAKGLAPGGIASRVSTSTAVIRRLLAQLDRGDVAA
ncbi:MAG TPA: hypothetical protein VHA75_11060 [Rugosimonospora sp.]|nr:hypothetical protein [Rugosimonospora sp.]